MAETKDKESELSVGADSASSSSKPDTADADQDKSGLADRAVRKMAQKMPEAMIEMTAMIGGVMGNPLHQKMDGTHVKQMLDLSIQHDGNEYDLRKRQQGIDNWQAHVERAVLFVCFLVFVGLLVSVLWIFKDKPEVLGPIISGLVGAGIGFVGGFGYGKSRKNDSSD